MATDITGAHEILDNSEFGLLVQEDVQDIYQGLKKMIDNDLMRAEYAQKALLRSEMFSVEKVLEEIDAVL